MPFIGSFSGSQLVRGAGAFHPGAITIDVSPTQPVNSVVATSTASTSSTGSTNRLIGLTTSSVSATPRTAYDPFGNGTITYSLTGSGIATGTITRVESANVYISFNTGAFANLSVGQPIYIGGAGATMGGIGAGTTYYIVSINSGSGLITLASSYANYQSTTVVTFATSSAGNASGYTWTDTYPTWTAGGGLPPGISYSGGVVSGAYTMNNSNGNGLNFDTPTGGVTGGNNSYSNYYAVQTLATNARSQASTVDVFNIQVAIPFEFRQILTTCYVMGGYKLSTPWANVNKCTGATDTNVNTGNNLSHSQAYTTGPCSWNYAYCMGANDSVSTASNQTIAWNMRTETSRTSNFSATWIDSVNGNACLQQEYYYAWLTAGATIREFNLSTETNSGTPGNQTGAGSSASAASHETRGIWNTANVNWAFATRTGTARTATAISGSGYYRIMQNKNPTTNQWASNGSIAMRSTNFPSDTTSDPGITEPSNGRNAGESNHTGVQDWGYCIGWYDGNHTADTYKFVYATQSGTFNANGMQYQGQAGNSSGWGAWRD